MLLREIIRSKIHGVHITKKELHYSGSLGIDKALIKKAGMAPGEKVQVLNFNNGKRLETYIIEEPEGSGIITLYGPAARCGEVGDKITVIAYAFVDEEGMKNLKTTVVLAGEGNKAK